MDRGCGHRKSRQAEIHGTVNVLDIALRAYSAYAYLDAQKARAAQQVVDGMGRTAYGYWLPHIRR